MYRAITWAALRAGIDVDDPVEVAAFAELPTVVSGTDPANPTIEVDGVDVAADIRSAEVTAAVSPVSAVPEVRARLVRIQREAAASARADGVGIVVEGRDIGTVVLPDADVKIFLTADPAVRALRRAKEQVEDADPESAHVAATEEALIARDAYDSSRATSPLTQADDGIVIDTTELSLDEVIGRVCSLVEDPA